MRHTLMLYILFFSLLVVEIQTALADDNPQQAQAVKLDDFNLSGYINVVGEAPSGGISSLSLDDLSLFAIGHINKAVNPFIEAEISGFTLWQNGEAPFSGGGPQYSLERIYNDSYLTKNLSLRIGKMFSPVGEWNVIHAPPLVLTTTRPMTTLRGFSGYTSGVALIYSDAKSAVPDIQIYVQPAGELRPTPTSRATRGYEHVAGFHLNFPFGLNDKLGLSFQHAQIQNTDSQQNLIGFNFSKELGPMEFESEAIHTHFSDADDDMLQSNEWGAYLQGAYAVRENWHLVGRFEYFVDRNSILASKNALFGIAYKTDSHAVWKIEYVNQFGQPLDIQTGIYASFSMLF